MLNVEQITLSQAKIIGFLNEKNGASFQEILLDCRWVASYTSDVLKELVDGQIIKKDEDYLYRLTDYGILTQIAYINEAQKVIDRITKD